MPGTGEYRKPIPEENIYYKRLGSGLVEGCQRLGPWASGQSRILGVVHCQVDESFKQIKEECDERLGTTKIVLKKVYESRVHAVCENCRSSENAASNATQQHRKGIYRQDSEDAQPHVQMKGRTVRTMPN